MTISIWWSVLSLRAWLHGGLQPWLKFRSAHRVEILLRLRAQFPRESLPRCENTVDAHARLPFSARDEQSNSDYMDFSACLAGLKMLARFEDTGLGFLARDELRPGRIPLHMIERKFHSFRWILAESLKLAIQSWREQIASSIAPSALKTRVFIHWFDKIKKRTRKDKKLGSLSANASSDSYASPVLRNLPRVPWLKLLVVPLPSVENVHENSNPPRVTFVHQNVTSKRLVGFSKTSRRNLSSARQRQA